MCSLNWKNEDMMVFFRVLYTDWIDIPYSLYKKKCHVQYPVCVSKKGYFYWPTFLPPTHMTGQKRNPTHTDNWMNSLNFIGQYKDKAQTSRFLFHALYPRTFYISFRRHRRCVVVVANTTTTASLLYMRPQEMASLFIYTIRSLYIIIAIY